MALMLGYDVTLVPEAANHPIVKDLQIKQWHSKGGIYKVAPLLDKEATVLLMGKVNDLVEPIAWTRMQARAGFSIYQWATLMISKRSNSLRC